MIIGRKKVIVTTPVYGNKEYISFSHSFDEGGPSWLALHRNHKFQIR